MNILIVYPHGNALNPHSGAETRIWNNIKILTNYNFKVVILHSQNSEEFEDIDLKQKCSVYYYKELKFFGIPDWYLSDFNPFFILKLIQIIRKYTFDIIQIEFPWGFISLQIIARKKSILIYDSLGVESEFIKVSMKNPKFPKFAKIFAKILAKFYEKLVCKLVNVIVTVSDIDRTYYIKNYKIEKNKTFLIQIPSKLKLEQSMDYEKQKEKSRKLLNLPLDKTIVIFHGGLPHPPNQEAFDLIINKISPKIKNKNIIFGLAGYNVERFRKSNIISLGYVQNLSDLLYSADFAIVPIISGSGMRVKCSDYITFSLPFITTEKGIEGINFLENEKDCFIFESVNEEFIECINKLESDLELRNKIKENLRKKAKYLDSKKIENRLIKLYLKLINQNINIRKKKK